MKKLLLLFALLITGFTYSQVSLAKVLKLVQITTAQRDGLTIAANEFPVIYNSTTTQFERYNGSTWETFVGGESITESQISDLSHTVEANNLGTAVTWANVPDANITQSSVTQHQAALSVTESQISDLTHTPATTSIVGITGTSAEFNTANTDDSFAFLGDAQTFTGINTFNDRIIGLNTLYSESYFFSTLNLTVAGWAMSTDASNNFRWGASELGTPSTFPTIYTLDATGSPTIATDLVTKAYADALAGAPEGTAVKSTGEVGGVKFLREDGDGTSSWQTLTGGGDALQSSPLSQFAATTSAQFASVISNETGTGSVVLATSPTLVTPVLGAATATTINGATITSGTLNGSVTGTNTGDQSSIVGITGTLAQFNTAISDGSIGTGDALVANPLSQFAATTSAQLAGVVSDEAGSGSLLFGSGTNTGDQTSIVGITGTSAQFNTANTSGSFAFLDEANTFTLDQTIDGSLVLNGAISGTVTIQAADESGTAILTLPSSNIDMDSFIAEVGANTAKTSNATHTGEVVGTTGLTIASGVVDSDNITNLTIVNEDIADDTISEGKLDMNNAPTDGYVNTYRSATGMGWEASTVGIARHPDSPVLIDSIYVGTVAQIAAAGLGTDVLAFPTDASNNLEDLDDVTETGITTGDNLEWSGSAWVNAKIERKFIIPLGAVGADIVVADDLTHIPVLDAITITRIEADLLTAPTGSGVTFDIELDDGTPASIFSTLLTVDATERFSSTAATPAVISDATIPADSFLTFNIDVIGSSIAGTDATITIYYTID